MRLIINADDLGRSREVNDAIAEMMAGRMITSATLMANAPFLEDALDKIPVAWRRTLGVHLNITEFRPLTAHPVWQGWVDDQGCFSLAAFREKPLTPRLKEAIGAEWTAQINRVRAYGLEVSHLDSHHDVHADPRLLGVLKCLQYRLKIRKIRLAENLSAAQTGSFLKNRVWNWALRHCPPLAITTAGFTSFATFLEAARHGPLSYPTLEVMVHPGHPHFSEESRRLKEPWRETLVFPVELISYADL